MSKLQLVIGNKNYSSWSLRPWMALTMAGLEFRETVIPLDVDVTFLSGYGFPRHRGGPMKYADMVGLDKVLADIEAFAQEDPLFWKPAPLLQKLVAEGRNFDSLNKAD